MLTSSFAKTLIVAAHPDDEVLGCGGFAAKIQKFGGTIEALIITAGRAGQETDNQIRSKAASKHVLTREPTILNYPDQQLETIPLTNLAQRILDVIDACKPTAVLTHSINDLNQDHRLVAEATFVAVRPTPACTVKAVGSYYVPSSTDWAFGQFGGFNPNFFVDISQTLDCKLKALECYEREMRDFPHPRSFDGIRAMHAFWGTMCGKPCAEAFQIVRMAA